MKHPPRRPAPQRLLACAFALWVEAAAVATLAAQPAASGGSPAPASLATPGALDAIAIFDRARATVADRPIPPFVAYTEDAMLIRHGKVQAQHERVVVRMSDGKANITPIRDSPADRVDTTPLVKERPLVYPTTTFGFVRRRTGEAPSLYEADSPPQPAPMPADGTPVIGHVVSTSRDYVPTLVGIEQIDGASVYHLTLVPRFDPQHHPIRELYVDTTSFDPRRMAIEVFASAGPVHSRPTVIVDFAPVDGTWVIARAAMDFVLRFGFLSYGGSGAYRTYDVGFPAAEPDWMFDAAALAEHLRAATSPDARRP